MAHQREGHPCLVILRLPTLPGLAIILALALIAALLAVSQSSSSVEAATFTVTTTADSGTGSLRDAITDANAATGADTITFDSGVFPAASPEGVVLSTALPTITGDLTIDATGAGVIIEGNLTSGADGLRFSGGTFSLIGGGGLTIQNFDADGVNINATGAVTISGTISGTTANRNDDDGVDIDKAASVRIDNSSADGNGEENAQGYDIDVEGDVTITNSSANGNAEDGFKLSSDRNIVLCGVTAIDNGEDGIDMEEDDSVGGTDELANARVTSSVVEENGAEGIDFDTSDLSSSGTFRANGNNISGNGTGLELDDAATTVDATGNWWGDSSGPTHPSNPGGSGDAVEDSVNNASGTVDFDPFLTSPNADAGTCPPPTITLTPETDTNTVGEDHTVTATVNDGDPVADVVVFFDVIDGPNNADTGTDTTDASGEATFTYTGDGGAGTDTIQACVSEVEVLGAVEPPGVGENGVVALPVTGPGTCTRAEKTWAAVLGAANDPPVAVDDKATVLKDSTNNVVDVLANDSDPDGDTLTVTNVSDPDNGTAATDGSQVTYTPDTGFGGKDTFTYTISDGTDTDTATVTIDVLAAQPEGGGEPSDGDSSAVPWLAAIAASLALMGAGSGLWLAYQRRRVR